MKSFLLSEIIGMDVPIVCRSLEQWKQVLTLYNPLFLAEEHYYESERNEEKGQCIYLDGGCRSGMEYMKEKYSHCFIEASDFIKANKPEFLPIIFN